MKITVDEARKAKVCRLCALPIGHRVPEAYWYDSDEYIVTGLDLIAERGGNEYAHSVCVEAAKEASAK